MATAKNTPRVRSAVLSAIVVLCSVAPAYAASITWSYAGTVGDSRIAALAGGVPMTFDWTFDPLEPNACAATGGGGNYAHQAGTVKIFSTIGVKTFQLGGILHSDNRGPYGCSSFNFFPEMELRLFWPRNPPFGPPRPPDFPDATLIDWIGTPPGMFWADPGKSLNGAFPTVQPQNAYFELNPFAPVEPGGIRFDQPIYMTTNLTAVEAAPVPEPASLLLLGTGTLGLIAWYRRRKE